jgi:CubicO group peptidase (beta-lactamase class C family)
MPDLSIKPSNLDTSPLRNATRQMVDEQIIPGASWALLQGRDLLDVGCVGWADRESRIELRPDHIFRIFSNTKLVTSICALQLIEAGRLGLDDPVARYLPQVQNLQVLRAGATRIEDTEPQRNPITIRHLLTHSAGFTLGLFDNGSPLFAAYTAHGVRSPEKTLAQMIDVLVKIPLMFQPGTGWEYSSVATDMLSRVLEVIEGERIDRIMSRRVFEPLDMADTGFVVPPGQVPRLVAYYAGASETEPWHPGLTRIDDEPYPGAYLKPMPRVSGGGGLVSTLGDWVALVRALIPGGPTLLREETLATMRQNHLPAGQTIGFSNTGPYTGCGHGLAGAVAIGAVPDDAAYRAGEFWWGGAAGSKWWINPSRNEAGVFMTQRRLGFWHPLSRRVRKALDEVGAAHSAKT